MIRKASVLVCSLVCSATSFAGERPKLGVVIVIDQLSAEAFHARLGKTTAGLKRLTSEGTVFDELRFEAAPTVTSAGHATLMTGTWPQSHGIVANEWFDAETGKPRLSTEDSNYHVLGRPAQERDGTAPTWLNAPTLSDSVRVANEAAKAVVISGKDRSAILCAGRAGTAVWFDAERPIFTTSTFYAQDIPPWVTGVNERIAKGVLSGAFTWGLPAGGVTGQAPALPVHGRDGDNEPFAERPELQPMIDAAEVDLALEAVKRLELGKDDVPDLLTVSFSGHDRIGHQFGPDSAEGLSEFLTLDKELGRLLDGLDLAVGKGKYVVALTSDHGVPPIPEVARARGLDAGHVDTRALGAALEQALDSALGPAEWIAGYKTPGFEVNPKLRSKVPLAFERLRAVAKQQPGVLDLLWSPSLSSSEADQAVWKRGAFAGRTVDLIVVTRPYWTYGAKDHTGHASPWLYDRAVPFVLFGAGVKKASLGSAEAIDVAPTVARLLGVPAPAAAIGHSIDAVFR